MSAWLGNFAAGQTVRKMWNTTAVAGESITRATNGTVQVYKDGGVAQSTAGVTDTEDFDGLTGVHLVAIDLSADGTFYSAGSEFEVVLAGATIDGKVINASLFSFAIANRIGVTAAQVNQEVVDALFTDTYAQPTGAPPATTSLARMLAQLYKHLRNRVTQTSTTQTLYNDDAVTPDITAAVSDDGTTFERGEFS
jgi:hypothetical protein